MLGLFGAKIGKGAAIYPDVNIWAPWNLSMGSGSCLGPRVICYNVAEISLEEGAVVSQGAHLCAATHDYRVSAFTLMVAPICIERGAWVAADAFVGPGVVIGERAVLGARGVTTTSIGRGDIMVGNPAKSIRKR